MNKKIFAEKLIEKTRTILGSGDIDIRENMMGSVRREILLQPKNKDCSFGLVVNEQEKPVIFTVYIHKEEHRFYEKEITYAAFDIIKEYENKKDEKYMKKYRDIVLEKLDSFIDKKTK